MIKCLILLFFGLGIVFGQTWSSRARIYNLEKFYEELMQETIYELENRGWHSLKLDGYTHTLNEQLYDWHVGGSVTYSNGFLISIQKLDVSQIQQTVILPQALVRGLLNMHHVQVGFDVEANVTRGDAYEIHKSTVSFTHNTVQLQLSLTKHSVTGEITGSATMFSLTSGDRLVYMPASNLTEVLARRYLASRNFDSVLRWGREVIVPIMVELAKTKVPFPKICFSC